MLELGGAVTYITALAVALRTRKPYFVGIFVACNLMVFWDWVFNSAWFFNVSYDERLLALWRVGDVEQPLFAVLAYVGFYSFVFYALAHFAPKLDDRFGARQWPILYVVAAVYVLIFESIFVSQGVWEYHQRDAFKLNGVAWSNAWYNAHLILLSYAMMRLLRRWAIPSLASRLDVGTERFWRDTTIAIAAISTGFFLAFCGQLIWYVLAEPWVVDSPRPF
ncbi:hypothetical protein [Candidatus Poriferisocius sp.]|uniref:hypothetical protein n=1 Tax=Candidatus Poriferisocius sp. TaxID=3101276 RepID=UPI003B01378C